MSMKMRYRLFLRRKSVYYAFDDTTKTFTSLKTKDKAKHAALDVVYRRLREEGLEPFCLELHSNKTGKADVVAQFDRSLRFITDDGATDWEHRAAELERLRDSLSGYARALHRRHPCGFSTYYSLDYLLPRQKETTVRLDAWPTILNTPMETLERALEVAKLLQQRSRPLIPLADHPLALLAREEWTPALEQH